MTASQTPAIELDINDLKAIRELQMTQVIDPTSALQWYKELHENINSLFLKPIMDYYKENANNSVVPVDTGDPNSVEIHLVHNAGAPISDSLRYRDFKASQLAEHAYDRIAPIVRSKIPNFARSGNLLQLMEAMKSYLLCMNPYKGDISKMLNRSRKRDETIQKYLDEFMFYFDIINPDHLESSYRFYLPKFVLEAHSSSFSSDLPRFSRAITSALPTIQSSAEMRQLLIREAPDCYS